MISTERRCFDIFEPVVRLKYNDCVCKVMKSRLEITIDSKVWTPNERAVKRLHREQL